MKKGFALLETIIVITFLSVSLLMLYNTFINMVNNSKKNILYDDAANIYKAYYFKEYLGLNGLDELVNTNSIKEISCDEFKIDSCNYLVQELDINKIYIAKYDLKDYAEEKYSSNLNNYLDTLSNKENYQYRIIFEFISGDTYAYSSLGV